MDSDKMWRFCVCGNIVLSHTGEDGKTYYGTKAFSGGTKVYIDGKGSTDIIGNTIQVIGMNRFGHYAIEYIDPALIENIRFQIIRKRTVLRIMEHMEIMEGYSYWGRTASDKREAKAFADRWNKGCFRKEYDG